MNNKMLKIASVLAKIGEILGWIADGVMVLLAIATLFFKDSLYQMLINGMDDGSLTVTGFDVSVLDYNDPFSTVALFIAFLAGVVSCGFTAMIFRNIWLITKSEKPFCKDTIRLVTEIGYFAISIPFIDIVFSVVLQLISHSSIEVSVDLTTVIYGFVVLCLAQFFKYGAELEKDVDGLV